MNQANIYTTAFSYDETDPDGYRAGAAAVGDAAGGQALKVKLYEVPPEQSVCPYHYEYEEEWLVVLTGSPTLRGPAGERELQPGELVCFAPGPSGAHKLTNRTADLVRALMFSSAREPAVSVYPDSDKIGVWSGNDADRAMLRRRDGNVDYYDGER
jgi:uncharacterized cupin superfamily protein